MTKGYVHSTDSFGSVDGPGIRYLIFLQGCDMRCRYCHNPDTWTHGAVANNVTEMTVDEILTKAERYRSYWRQNGGITVSGGEPLLQIDFLIELFEEAHKRGITTCLDTCAQPFRREGEFFEKFERLMAVTDTVLLDIKHIVSEEHKALTGHRNENILECAKYLSDINKPVWIRHVLVPGITDKVEHLKELRLFLDTLTNVVKIEILPYHSMAEFKYEQLGIEYTLKGVLPPSKESVEEARRILLA
ncbi:MAG: pyruvate formate-lyase-activating protein [Bacteroidales bacterium]|nr:pyruvate formate-lyase-activating protein [Bacteroidales bacterium]